MIRFCCEHCGHKIGVEETHVGKRGKCPACGTIVTVPAESTLIEFDCGDCGRRLAVPKIQSGKKVVCPKCENVIIVPAAGETPAVSIGVIRFACSTCKWQIEEPESSRGKLVECPHCKNYVAVPSAEIPAQEVAVPLQLTTQLDKSEEHFEQMQKDQGTIAPQEPEPVLERKLPWILDIFLYPSSKAGLTTLAIIIFVPLLIRIVASWLNTFALRFPPMLVLAVPISFVGFIISLLLSLYLYWYFCECIRDSAAGGIRAPETVGATPGLGDLLWQCLRTIGCLAVFAAPTLIYYGHARQIDSVFWALLAVGVFAFPMALLAVVMFDSFSGLNPILLVSSIFSTFLPYCAMIAVFVPVVFLTVKESLATQGSAILSFIINCVRIYLALIVAHVLGWFYHRYKEKLNWEV